MTKKNGKIIDEKTTCKLIFIDSIRFMLKISTKMNVNIIETSAYSAWKKVVKPNNNFKIGLLKCISSTLLIYCNIRISMAGEFKKK